MTTPSDYYSSPRQEVAEFLPDLPNPCVLEIGCGEGAFSTQVPAAREYWGVEPHLEAAIVAEKRLTRVLVKSYQSCQDDLPDRYFDLLVCNDVIEHMTDHDSFLDSVKRKLARGAYIIGSVPNVRHFSVLYRLLIKKDWPYADSGILDRTHLRFFTEESLRRSLIRAGYDLELLAGINSSFGSSAATRHALQRYAFRAFVWATLGYYRDIEFVQLGFRARVSG
jgi:SAM-dependent methyltransferase